MSEFIRRNGGWEGKEGMGWEGKGGEYKFNSTERNTVESLKYKFSSEHDKENSMRGLTADKISGWIPSAKLRFPQRSGVHASETRDIVEAKSRAL